MSKASSTRRSRAAATAFTPGYGFLSENSRLAKLTADAGLTFIGPSADVLALFGDKVRARELARAEGIPVIAGSDAPLATPGAGRRTGPKDSVTR